MPLPRLATVDGLEARLGTSLTGDDLRRAEAMLDDASALIRAEAGVTWLDAGGRLADVPELIASICMAVAYRAYKNPEGVAQSSVGDVSLSYGRTPPGAVWLTPDERRQVRRLGGGAPSIKTAQLVAPDDETTTYFVDVVGGGDPINMGPPPWEMQ